MDYKQRFEKRGEVDHYFNPSTSTLPLYLKAENKIITLRNIQGPLATKVTVRPTQKANTGELLGVERLDENQKKDRHYTVDKRTKIELTEGTTFDLSDDVQRANWNWVQYSVYIVQTKEDALAAPMAIFYIEDTERDTNKRNKKDETLYNAEKMVRDWSEDVRMNRARLLGQDLSYHTPGEVLTYLVEYARSNEHNAKNILEIESDPYKNERLELLRWQDLKLVEVKNGGSYYFDQIRIGADERTALAWILQVENREIVDSIRGKFASKRAANLSGASTIPVRGEGAAPVASSTSVNPPMTAPRQINPNTVTLEKLAEAAPVAYANLLDTLDAGTIAFLRENPDEGLFKELIAQEIRERMQRRNLQPVGERPGLWNGKPDVVNPDEVKALVPSFQRLQTRDAAQVAHLDQQTSREAQQAVARSQNAEEFEIIDGGDEDQGSNYQDLEDEHEAEEPDVDNDTLPLGEQQDEALGTVGTTPTPPAAPSTLGGLKAATGRGGRPKRGATPSVDTATPLS